MIELTAGISREHGGVEGYRDGTQRRGCRSSLVVDQCIVARHVVVIMPLLSARSLLFRVIVLMPDLKCFPQRICVYPVLLDANVVEMQYRLH